MSRLGPRGARWLALALALVSLLLYARVGWHEWLNWDDPWLISENPGLQRFDTATLRKIFFDLSFQTRMVYGAEYLPLRDLSAILDNVTFRGWPGGTLLLNAVLYALGVVLFFWLVRRIHVDTFVAFFSALLFAVHPLHVESVAWASSRKDVLALVAFMASLLMFERFLRDGRRRQWLGSVLLFLLAMTGKYVAIVLPAFVALRWAWHSGARPRGEWLRRGAMLLAPYAAIAVAYQWIILRVGAQVGTVATPISERPGVVLLTVLDILRRYAGAVLLPLWLSPDYLVTPVDSLASWRGAGALATAGALVALLGVLIARVARRRGEDSPSAATLFWVLWFIASLLPFAQIVPIENRMADRYMLLPLMSPAVLAAYWAWRVVLRRPRWRTPVTVALLVWAGLLGALTVRQVGYWHDSVRLWQRAVVVEPDSPRALYQLSVSYEARRMYDEEAVILERLLQEEPGHARGLNNLGINMFRRGGERDEIIRLYVELIRRHPEDFKALHNLAVVLIAEQRYDEAIECLERSLQLRPDYCSALLNLGRAQLLRGDRQRARERFEQALACNPRMQAARRFLNQLDTGTQEPVEQAR